MRTATISTLFFALLLLPCISQGQSICDEGDCPSEILNIDLNVPLNPTQEAPLDKERIEKFKTAFQSYKSISGMLAQNPDWQIKYEGFQLAGKSCLRLYQLESSFVYEYHQNPAFKSYIDAQGSDLTTFKEMGFKASRRGLNLERRMRDQCLREVRISQSKTAPELEHLPKQYMKLGQIQGYFDEEGKILKELKDPEEAAAEAEAKVKPVKISKKEQIAQVGTQLNDLNLPHDKLRDIANTLSTVKSQEEDCKNQLQALLPRMKNLQRENAELMSGLTKLTQEQTKLNAHTLRAPDPGLVSRLEKLLKAGNALSDKARTLEGKQKKLNGKHEKLDKEMTEALEELGKKEAKNTELQGELKRLETQKKEAEAMLADKPKKYLDQLKLSAGELETNVEGLNQQVDEEEAGVDKIAKQSDELCKDKSGIEKELEDLEKELQDLAQRKEELEQGTREADTEVAEAKEKEAEEEAKALAFSALKDLISGLDSEPEWQEELKECNEQISDESSRLASLASDQKMIDKDLNELRILPEKSQTQLKGLNEEHSKLKLGKRGIPISEKTLGKVNELIDRGTNLDSNLKSLDEKKEDLESQIEDIEDNLKELMEELKAREKEQEEQSSELVDLTIEKAMINKVLDQGSENLAPTEKRLKDFVKRYNSFDSRNRCNNLDRLREKIEALKKEQEHAESELESLTKELNEVEKEVEILDRDTELVEDELEEATRKVEELLAEEETLKETFREELKDKDLKLEPVKIKEWAEQVEVKRTYWDAVFYPDNEVVEGYKGRYFKIRLKEADKNVKLQFGSGKYFIKPDLFQEKYGLTLGTFVTEAGHVLRESEKDKVIIFVQGSADLSGHDVFEEDLDSDYLYTNIDVLPRKTDQDSFSNESIQKEIPEENFTNSHLPDLRGNFLKEMITTYSKKLKPVQLEGEVKRVRAEGERNAIIYLFLPDEVLGEEE